MRKVLLVALLLLTFAVPTLPAFQTGVCPGLPVAVDPFTDESKTVSSTAVSLTAATHSPGTDAKLWAVVAVITVTGDAIRYRLRGAGNLPTASVGHLVPVNSQMIVCGNTAITNLRMIRVTTDATAYVSYFRRR